ncbi:hypothetical protein F5148DRAFT_1220725 [Russula earlei]|uniref:Uncharacterized protein n=1 Tax=Russula earlei TaxID=71964 RepID=A0ACC0U2Z8_9AGAM|nr:hypothetical protein F5148DRAFT_1220725 [Russula earlei]
MSYSLAPVLFHLMFHVPLLPLITQFSLLVLQYLRLVATVSNNSFDGTLTTGRSFSSPSRTHAHSCTPLPMPLGHQTLDPGHNLCLLSVPPCP